MTETPTNVPPTLSHAAPVACVRCGYNLTGSALGGTCPECGTPVTRSIGGNATDPTSGFAIASLVMGILTLVSCSAWGLPGLLFGPLGLIFAHVARGQIARGEVGGASAGLAKAGMVCSLIGLALSAVGIVLVIVLFAIPLMMSL